MLKGAEFCTFGTLTCDREVGVRRPTNTTADLFPSDDAQRLSVQLSQQVLAVADADWWVVFSDLFGGELRRFMRQQELLNPFPISGYLIKAHRPVTHALKGQATVFTAACELIDGAYLNSAAAVFDPL